MDTIYVERSIRKHPRAAKVLERFSAATVIECEHYGEVFNKRSQNFRLQKQRPALILAEKSGQAVLPTPPSYTIGRSENFYFSHLLNCLYDCRYCFLQGMYPSANYVFFVNWDHFEHEIEAQSQQNHANGCFFSGYDGDSLAMESITGFADHFIPFFSSRPQAWLELRTKSINTRPLEQADPVPNIIPAFTLSPDEIAQAVEAGAPSFSRRLKRVQSLTQQGWKVGLRLDPLIPWPHFSKIYREMIEAIFDAIEGDQVHSVTLGPMRFPKSMYQRIIKLYPEDPLFALQEMTLRDGQMTYPEAIEDELVHMVESELQQHVSQERIFRQTG